MARIIYIVNPLYYMSEALTVIFSFQFLVLLYFHADSLSIWNSLYFLPYIVLNRVLIPTTKTNRNKLGTKLAALSNSYTYFYTYIRMIFKGVPAWQPTGVKTSTLHHDFVAAFDIGTVISSLFILGFLFVLLSRPEILGNYNTYMVLGWSFYSIFWHALFLTFVLQYIHHVKLTDIKSTTHKAFLYVKTHSLLVLFFMLVGSTITNLVLVTSQNNTNPTKQVINNLIAHASQLRD